MHLSQEEINHLAELARLELSDKEKQMFGEQLSSILDYLDKLRAVDTTDVPLTAQVTGQKNVWREDEIKNCDEATRKRLLDNLPEREGDLMKTKAVFG
ncbi:MAG: Asp-tRNA(Asn)/Glu-tRNA(Gln) amidotransferase subunit GatC [Patescibacteria group bacterium]